MRLSVRRVISSVIYFGSAACAVASLGRAGAALDTVDLFLNLFGLTLWCMAAAHSLYLDCRQVTGGAQDHRRQQDEGVGLEVSSHAKINASLYLGSSAAYLASDLRYCGSLQRGRIYRLLSDLAWLKNACMNLLIALAPRSCPCGTDASICNFIAEVDSLLSGFFDSLGISLDPNPDPADIASNVCWIIPSVYDLAQAGQSLMGRERLQRSGSDLSDSDASTALHEYPSDEDVEELSGSPVWRVGPSMP